MSERDGGRSAEHVDAAMLSLWQAANHLSQVPPPACEHFRVTIFGSARIKPGDALYADVKELARALSALGCDIVSGGGPGLMQAANEGSQLGDPEDRLQSIGVRIDLPFEQNANPYVEKVYTHATFFTRLHQFMRLSDAFVVVAGGVGTTLELMLVWQLLQVRHATEVPLVLVGPMWRDLVAWARQHMLGGATAYASPADLALPICVDTPEAALAALRPFQERFLARRAAPR
ncbi:MAG: LOG family protein [Myxococcales bacterium]|nr:LOG family protein [Myxococcales bacterium]